MGQLEVEIVRATGESLAGTREPIYFRLTLGHPGPSSRACYETTKKKRGYMFDFRSSFSNTTVEWNEFIGNLSIQDSGDSITLQCFKGEKFIGHVTIWVDGLPQAEEVSKWFQLYDESRRNVNALVFLKLKYDNAPEVLANTRQRADSAIGSSDAYIPVAGSSHPMVGRSLRLLPSEKSALSSSRSHTNSNISSTNSIATYFAVVGVSPTDLAKIDSLRLAMVQQGGNSGDATKSENSPTAAGSNTILLEPSVLQIFPAPPGHADEDSRFPTSLPSMLYYPGGLSALQPQVQPGDPVCYSFFLSNSKTYVTALTFWHLAPGVSAETTSGSLPPMYIPTTWCLLGNQQYCVQFRELLAEIYNTYIQPIVLSGVQPHSMGADAYGVMCEQYISQLVAECPIELNSIRFALPSTKIESNDQQSYIEFSSPGRFLCLPLHYFSLTRLLDTLSIDQITTILGCLLNGCKLLFHSSQVSMLLPTCECIMTLLFPLTWPNIYVPVLPESMLAVIESPVPFLVGTTTMSLGRANIPRDVIVVDIDRGFIMSSTSTPMVPIEATRVLRKRIRQIVYPQLFRADELSTVRAQCELELTLRYRCGSREDMKLNRDIQIEFLKYIAALLKDYRDFLFFDQSDRPVFDEAKFLEHRIDAQPFLSKLLRTQMFLSFLDMHIKSPNFLQDHILFILEGHESTSQSHSTIESELSRPLPLNDVKQSSGTFMLLDWERINDSFIVVETPLKNGKRTSKSPQEQQRSTTMDTLQAPRMTSTSSSSSSSMGGTRRRLRRDYASYLMAKSRLEKDRGDRSSRVHDVICTLLSNHHCTFTQLSAACELLRLGIWRDILSSVLSERVASSTSLQLETRAFDDLAFLLHFVLDQCAEEVDYSTTKIILQASCRICCRHHDKRDIDDESKTRVYLRDALRQHRIWLRERLWAYVLAVELLSNGDHRVMRHPTPELRRNISMPQLDQLMSESSTITSMDRCVSDSVAAASNVQSSSNDASDIVISTTTTTTGAITELTNPITISTCDRGVIPLFDSPRRRREWQDFVFSAICSILCTLQTLEIPHSTAERIVLFLANMQQLEKQQLDDLNTVITNVYRTPRSLSSMQRQLLNEEVEDHRNGQVHSESSSSGGDDDDDDDDDNKSVKSNDEVSNAQLQVKDDDKPTFQHMSQQRRLNREVVQRVKALGNDVKDNDDVIVDSHHEIESTKTSIVQGVKDVTMMMMQRRGTI